MPNNNGTWKKVAELLMIILVPMVGVAVAWGVLSENDRHQDREIEEVRNKVDANITHNSKQDTEIAVMKTQQTSILEGVKRIEKKVDALHP